tara:strand:+ start:3511 stop:4380 length:870 start_codon:yes stop_codon:yes gene_type:complete
MTVYLGTYGKVELRRQFDGSELYFTITTGDVDNTRKRFGCNLKHGQLSTGDQVEITSTDNVALSFVSGYTQTSIKKFLHIDDVDGIRLYDTFADAINGGIPNAVALAEPASNIRIRVEVQNADYRLLAQVDSFELNTQRETADITTLSDEFRSQVSTLLSGSGRMSCFWEYTGDTVNDLPHYLIQLLLRTKVGGNFSARFYLKSANYNPSGVAAALNDQIWYEFEGVLTSCATQITPDSAVKIAADFITTGEIKLQVEMESTDFLLQEDNGKIQEEDSDAKLLLESSDT